MTSANFTPTRRSLLAGAAGGAAVLLLPGCASTGGFSMVEAVRRLLLLASENAFARLTAPGGFWDEQVAQLGLANLMGTRGDVLSRILTSALVKDRLEERFATFAIDASFRAAPVVTDAIQLIGFENAIDLVRGGPTAASSYLRGEVGPALIDAVVPELGEAIRLSRDPLIGQALSALTGVDAAGVADRLGREVDNAIWGEIAREEAAIRAIQDGKTKYTDVDGIPELKDAICAKFKRENGLDYQPNQAFVAPGGKPIIYSLGNFLFNGFDTPATTTGWVLSARVDRTGVVDWRTHVARLDANGVPHPDPTASSPCASPDRKTINQCAGE